MSNYEAESKICEAIRSKYHYDQEGEELINWLMENLK